MAEIKSTLDLIMERTKDLTLTEAEKKDIRSKEAQSRVRGWLQRYIDRVLTVRDLKENMEHEQAAFPEAADFLRKECLAHIDPEADNRQIFQIMKEILDIDHAPFQRLIDHFHEEMGQLRAKATRDVTNVLRSREISGTAVIPNLNLDPAWNASLEGTRAQFRSQLYLVK